MRKSFRLAALADLVPTFPLRLASLVIQALVLAWAYPRLLPPARTPWWLGARPMDITGMPMKGFVWVDAQEAEGPRLDAWIDLDARFVGGLPPMWRPARADTDGSTFAAATGAFSARPGRVRPGYPAQSGGPRRFRPHSRSR
jgi:hypothetical protein